MSDRHHRRKVVVLSINNNTNHVFRSISSHHAPHFDPGTLARKAFFELLRDGYNQVAEMEGNTYTVVGFVKEKRLHDGADVMLTSDSMDLEVDD